MLTSKQRQVVRTDNYKEDSSLASQDGKNVNLSRQSKFTKGEYLEYYNITEIFIIIFYPQVVRDRS